MARADALRAPEAMNFANRNRRRGAGKERKRMWRLESPPGADAGLVLTEPLLRRLIPAVTIGFLIATAFACVAALMAERDDIERNAKALLALTASELSHAVALSGSIDGVGERIRSSSRLGIAAQGVLLVADEDQRIVQASAHVASWIDRPLGAIIEGAQPLVLFGRDAGVMTVTIDGQPWYAAYRTLDAPAAGVASLAPVSAIFAEWRQAVTLYVTLFALTSVILLMVLWAYFNQVARAEGSERLFIEANERVDLALVRGRCGLWDWDMGRGKMYWSRSMYQMLGYEPCDGMLSFGEVSDIIHPDDADLFGIANDIAARRLDQVDRVFRMRTADDEWVWVRARAQVIDPDARELHLIGIAVDVSEQRHLAMQSEAADLRLRTAIESISESFVLFDASERLVMCNTKFQKDTGLADRDLLPGMKRAEIEARMLQPTLQRRLPSADGRAGGSTYERQLADGRWIQVNELRTRDGGMVAVGSDITKLKQNQDKLLDSERRLMANLHDLTELRRADEQHGRELADLNRKYMRETERAEAANKAKSEFLANMSHELRTPLNAIIGFSEMMQQKMFGPLGSDHYEEYVGDIHEAGAYLLNVINDILDMSKIEAGQFSLEREELDLCPLIRETVRVVALQAADKNITVETNIADTMSVNADRRAIKQIAINLLSNAVKFTDEGGKITVRARRVSGAMMLTIEDTGRGIPKEALKKLGRPFEQVQNQFTRTHTGSGLGLAISRSLAQLHGGALKIRSTEGVGTIVSVRIPCRAAVKDEKERKVA
ncbi:MAG: PAS domain-containing protein [Rhizobiaceae bacterium]|nr:PAS domain-containing protein [Rhizobiaceae bacterium]MCV0405442.1 PAS domain-containing protein [Rhizobiaceae bacterium]